MMMSCWFCSAPPCAVRICVVFAFRSAIVCCMTAVCASVCRPAAAMRSLNAWFCACEVAKFAFWVACAAFDCACDDIYAPPSEVAAERPSAAGITQAGRDAAAAAPAPAARPPAATPPTSAAALAVASEAAVALTGSHIVRYLQL